MPASRLLLDVQGTLPLEEVEFLGITTERLKGVVSDPMHETLSRKDFFAK